MNRTDFRFFDRLRVRWAEVDMQKIVFNGHYLMYFDTAIAGYWRALALPYAETMEMLHGDLFVRKATLEYEGSARYDEICEVGIRCGRIGNSSMVLHAALFRGAQRLVHGELVYVFADPATQSSRPVPASLRELLQAFEAGEAMVDVRLGSWDELHALAAPIRKAVFVDELKVPAAFEPDGADGLSLHALAVNRYGVPLGTGRLLQAVAGTAQIGRLAVLPVMRGSGIGRRLLDALVTAARERGDPAVMLQAQTAAAGFYAHAGFVAHGAVFEEAGIAHVAMQRRL